MKKLKLALCLSAALLATSAQAQWQGNWLLGVSGGWAWADNEDDITVSIATPALGVASTFTVSNDHDRSRGIWGFLAGYQATCNGWLLGAEVNVDWRTNDDDQDFTFFSPLLGTTVVGNFSRDRDAVVGLTGRLGYEVSPWFMPYVRAGVDYGRRNHDFTLMTTTLASNVTVGFGDSDNNRWGFIGGVGAEFPLAMIVSGLSLRAEWDFHTRGHNDDDNNNLVAVVNVPSVVTPSVIGISGIGESHEQTARISLVFNFPG